MTEELTVEELEDYLKKGLAPMKQIHQYFQGDPALDGMDQARAMRKIRSILNSSSSIVKMGDKRGAVYVYDPDFAVDVETTGLVENKVIHLHLKNGGILGLNDEPYTELENDYSEEAVNNALNSLLSQRILEMTRTETKLTVGFWEHSGNMNRVSTSFTHSTVIGWHIEELVKQLEQLNDEEKKNFPGTKIPVPIRPSRSTAIEAAVTLAVHHLSYTAD